jgi:hypothetical protein
MILFLPDIHEKLFIRFKGNPIHKLFQDIRVYVMTINVVFTVIKEHSIQKYFDDHK